MGEPLTGDDIDAFTSRITNFWKEIDYFNWAYEISHGMDASTGYPDYLIWWQDVDATKAGDKVTFWHNPAQGGSHNNAKPTTAALSAAIGGYFEAFPNWDLWDESVPDGTYDFRTGYIPENKPEHIRAAEIAFILEHCWSPFRNPAGAQFVDCTVVGDPQQWGL